MKNIEVHMHLRRLLIPLKVRKRFKAKSKKWMRKFQSWKPKIVFSKIKIRNLLKWSGKIIKT
jgi:hypothetical protein